MSISRQDIEQMDAHPLCVINDYAAQRIEIVDSVAHGHFVNLLRSDFDLILPALGWSARERWFVRIASQSVHLPAESSVVADIACALAQDCLSDSNLIYPPALCTIHVAMQDLPTGSGIVIMGDFSARYYHSIPCSAIPRGYVLVIPAGRQHLRLRFNQLVATWELSRNMQCFAFPRLIRVPQTSSVLDMTL